MTLNTTGYTVATNEPLTHARILWDMLDGTVTGDGTNPSFAANDYTSQRWELAAGANDWTLTLGAAADVDTVFISAHNLSGITFRPQYLGADVTNLLTHSEQFDNAFWPKTRASITPNATEAPDGTSTADKFVEDTSANSHFIRKTGFASDERTLSIYAKAAERNWVMIFTGSIGTTRTWFNIQNGTVGTSEHADAGIEIAGDGWYRVWVVDPAQVEVGIQIATGNGSLAYAGDGTSGIFIWGAQLQTGSEATSYIKTEASAVTAGWRDMTSWVTPTDNSTIAILANKPNGDPYNTTGVRLAVSNAAADTKVGIIRAGKALQMQRSFYGGYAPIRLNRVTEGQQSFSETGQWLGRTEKRRALSTTYNWQHLRADWYRTNFEPFAKTLPLKPFGIVSNPSRMSDDVAWAWTQEDPAPSNMGITDLMQVSLNVTGYWS